MQSVNRRIDGFDGVRAVAFLMVFVSHKLPTPMTDRLGSAGVFVFFVLSGFLITRILVEARAAIDTHGFDPWDELWRFWLRRALRIFPVYFVFLTVMTVLGWLGLVDIGTGFRQLSNAVFLSNLFIELRGWGGGMGHLWSLAVEEQYYLLFAPLALLGPRNTIAALCLRMLALSIAVHLLFAVVVPRNLSLDVNSVANFGLMAIGGLAGLGCERPLPGGLASDRALSVAIAAIFLLPIVMSSQTLWLASGRIIGFPAALLLIHLYQNQNGWLVRGLAVAPLRRLGILSYGAYLFHHEIKINGALTALGLTGDLPLAVTMPLELALTIWLADVSWRRLERPLRDFFRGPVLAPSSVGTS
jgi:peptidoglycan/LPS O-acetylase OafA/YrhL